MPTRVQRAHTEEWSQITQMCLWPEQRKYELLRPKSIPEIMTFPPREGFSLVTALVRVACYGKMSL